MTDEAALLDRHLRRLTRGHPGARGLSDDVALLGPGEAVVTKDLLVADVHFFASDALSDIGFKAIATNASDLIAKGVRPAAYFLGLSLPEGGATPETQVGTLAQGTDEALDAFGGAVLGGDLTRCAGPLTISVTAIGLACAGAVPDRGGASPGDAIFVTGAPDVSACWPTSGDRRAPGSSALLGMSALGLKLRLEPDGPFARFLSANALDPAPYLHAYLRPAPPIALVDEIGTFASASMDISDGLALDLERLTTASDCSARIALRAIARTTASRAAQDAGVIGWEPFVTGGDDYQTLLTVAARDAGAFQQAAQSAGVAVHQLGWITARAGDAAGPRTTFYDADLAALASGQPEPAQWMPQHRGHDHFRT